MTVFWTGLGEFFASFICFLELCISQMSTAFCFNCIYMRRRLEGWSSYFTNQESRCGEMRGL